MPFTIQARLDTSGAKALLASLEGALQRKALRRGVTASARVLLKGARQRVPVATGLLRKSLGVVVRSYRRGTLLVALIGPRKGFKQPVVRVGGAQALAASARGRSLAAQAGARTEMRDPVRYAHLVELGTSRSAAQAFLRPAFDAMRPAAEQAFVAAVRQVLDESLGARR